MKVPIPLPGDSIGQEEVVNTEKISRLVTEKDVPTRHGDAVGQSFPLPEVNPNHGYGWCVAESKAKA